MAIANKSRIGGLFSYKSGVRRVSVAVVLNDDDILLGAAGASTGRREKGLARTPWYDGVFIRDSQRL